MDLSSFLSLAGWSTPEPNRAANMSKALEFFTRTLGDGKLHSRITDPSPWLVAKGGLPLRIMELMQCNDFSSDITERELSPGMKLVCYRSSSQIKAKKLGQYYTTPGTGPGVLAILPEQDTPVLVTVKQRTVALESKAGDAFASWSEGLPIDGSLYRRGGGTQFFVPDPTLTFGGWPS